MMNKIKFLIKKDDKYLCMINSEHTIRFEMNKKDAILFDNRRFAENIAYDYNAHIVEIDYE